MNESEKQKVFQVNCPCCGAELWIDSINEEIIKSEKGKRRKSSFEDLLLKEKKKRESYDRKFEATAELEKKKLKKTQEKFEKALNDFDKTG